jgi:hypothetical protein
MKANLAGFQNFWIRPGIYMKDSVLAKSTAFDLNLVF